MIDNVSFVTLGDVMVHTTDNRGHTPDEIAEFALDRIVSIGENAHPLIAEQAHAFRDNIRSVLVYYMREAVRSHNVTLVSKFTAAGFPELVKILDT
jgi:hypothetical protein